MTAFLGEAFSKVTENVRSLFMPLICATFNDILGRSHTLSYQTTSSFTADAFLRSFTAKVRSVREETDGCPPTIYSL